MSSAGDTPGGTLPAAPAPAPAPAGRPLRRILAARFLAIAAGPLVVATLLWGALAGPAALHEVERRNDEASVLLRSDIEAGLAAPRAALRLAGALLEDPALPAAARTSLLQHAIDGTPSFEGLYLVGADGIVEVAALGARTGRMADLAGIDFSSRPFWLEARASRTEVWSDSFLSPFTGRVTAALAVPVGPKLLVADISLERLADDLGRRAREVDAAVIVLDGQGRVIVHPQRQLTAWQENLGQWPLVQRARTDGQARGELVLGDDTWLADVRRAEPTRWLVLVAQPRSRLVAPLWRFAGVVALAVLLALAVAVVASLREARRVAGQYRRFTDAAQSVAEGRAIDRELGFGSQEAQALWDRLHRLLERLREEERRTDGARADLQAVLDAATEVSIIATDEAGIVRLFNRGAAKLLGWPAEAVVGQSGLARFHDARELEARRVALREETGRDAPGEEVLVATARREGYEVRDWTYVRRDRARLLVAVAVTAVRDDEGALHGFLHVGVDQTSRQRAREAEVERAKADAANRAKSDFLSRVSHELRTPLNAMLGFAQLLARDADSPLAPRQAERVGHIESAGWQLLRLIDDVLDLSRVDSGEVVVRPAPVDLRAALAAAMARAAPAAGIAGVALAGPGEGPTVTATADPARLAQVLDQLVGNAVKYNRPGGEVQATVQAAQAGRVVASVRDTGRGMDPDQLARLFTPFDRLGLEGSGVAGSGIGLVTAKRLVERMRGRVEVRSTAGLGSTFAITLPASEESPEAVDAAPPETRAAAAAAAATPPAVDADAVLVDIVCVEDDAANLEVLRSTLAMRPNCRLHTCDRVQAARALISRVRPRLVLADLHLPDGSGFDLLEGLRADPALAATPVVIVSADATAAQAARAKALGAVDYVTKPVRLDRMLALVDRLV